MAQYRIVYIPDLGDRETPPEIMECPDDRAAMETAIVMLGDRMAEVWEGDRLVIRLASPPGSSDEPGR
jgi:hypothetical protein